MKPSEYTPAPERGLEMSMIPMAGATILMRLYNMSYIGTDPSYRQGNL